MRGRGTGDGGQGTGWKSACVLFLVACSPIAPAQMRKPRVVRPLKLVRPRADALPPILRHAIEASATVRFTGRRTVTVLRDGQPDRHEEIVMRDGPRLRIEFPSGGTYGGQVVVEDGKTRRHFLPNTNEVRLLPTRNEEGLQRLRALARTGNVAVSPGDSVAGYPTVEVVARDAVGNTLQRLAIEPSTGIVLRRRVFDATGTEVGGFVFTKVDPNPAPFDPSLFRIERKGVKVTTPWDQLQRVARRSGYDALGLPESTGFRLDGVRLAKLPEGPVLVQNYVGPGGRLSFYQLRAAVNPDRLRKQGRGRLNVRSWVDGGVTFVLLGPQDDATLGRLQGAVGRGP